MAAGRSRQALNRPLTTSYIFSSENLVSRRQPAQTLKASLTAGRSRQALNRPLTTSYI